MNQLSYNISLREFYLSIFTFSLINVSFLVCQVFTYIFQVHKDSRTRIYGVLVYKFKKLILGKNDFSFQFRKIITSYRRIGYNLNVMRQSACLVFNPIMVDNYAAFFNCTPVGRASDSMMAPT